MGLYDALFRPCAPFHIFALDPFEGGGAETGAQASIGLRSPLRFRSVLLLPEEHVDITKSAVFGDNLLFWLLEGQRSAPNLVDPSKVPVKAAPFTGDTSLARVER